MYFTIQFIEIKNIEICILFIFKYINYLNAQQQYKYEYDLVNNHNYILSVKHTYKFH